MSGESFGNPKLVATDAAWCPEQEIGYLEEHLYYPRQDLEGQMHTASPFMMKELQTIEIECHCCLKLQCKLEGLKKLHKIQIEEMSHKMEEMRLQVFLR